jgi:hypothetical protein
MDRCYEIEVICRGVILTDRAELALVCECRNVALRPDLRLAVWRHRIERARLVDHILASPSIIAYRLIALTLEVIENDTVFQHVAKM